MRKKTVSILAILLFVIAIIVKAGVSKNTNNVTRTSESNKQQTMTEETDDIIEETVTSVDNVTDISSFKTAQSKDSQVNGKLKISIDFNRSSTPASNQYAVWIEDMDGNVVKTLFVTNFTSNGGYAVRENSIPTWVAHAKPSDMDKTRIDAITVATPSTGTHSYIWDGTDDNGNRVADGTYIFYVEGTLYWSSIVRYEGTVNMGDSENSTLDVKAVYTVTTTISVNATSPFQTAPTMVFGKSGQCIKECVRNKTELLIYDFEKTINDFEENGRISISNSLIK